jgi:hypothetical protein
MESRLLRLLLFVIVTTAGISLALSAGGVPRARTGVDPLMWFMEGRQGGDSWRPGLAALDVAETLHTRSRGLYDKVFFQAKVGHKGFQYPPTALLPLRAARAAAGNDAFTALALINWLSVPVLMVAALSLLHPDTAFSRRDQVLAALVVVCATLLFYPAMRAYRNGQMQAWINALFTVALALYARHRPGAAGAGLALAAMIKPQLGLFALWALLRRERSMLAAFVLVVAIGTAATLAWLGPAPFLGYLDVLQHIARRGETFYPNQSVNGFMNRLIGNGSSVDFGDAMPEPNSLVGMATVLTSLLWLVLALAPPRAARGSLGSSLDFAFMGLMATLASPIAWEHHYGILLPAFALLAGSWLRGELRGLQFWLVALAWILTANSWEAANVFAATPFRFLQSSLLAGVVALAIALRLGSPRPTSAPAGDRNSGRLALC